LPCGSILSVQPADFDWKNKKKETAIATTITQQNNNSSNLVSGEKDAVSDEIVSNNVNEGEDDDLDGFFASLE
jgi:hypothetical protein